MPDLLILGRGIAGCCAYQAAVERGAAVELVGDHPHASAAAIAVIADQRRPDRARFAAHWYDYRGFDVKHRAVWSTYRNPVPHHRVDTHFAVDPAAILALGEKAAAEGTTGEARARLDCRALGDGAAMSYGATWYHPDPAALVTAELRVHLLRPYTEIHAVAWPSGARIGSTVASSPAGARLRAEEFIDHARRHGWLTTDDGWTLLEGARVRRAHPIERVSANTVRFGGFHRSGYTLAPLLARLAVDAALR